MNGWVRWIICKIVKQQQHISISCIIQIISFEARFVKHFLKICYSNIEKVENQIRFEYLFKKKKDIKT